MWEFLQTYGLWIVFGIISILMMRMHSGGMHGMGSSCGMGMNHDQEQHDGLSRTPTQSQQAMQFEDAETYTRQAIPLYGEDGESLEKLDDAVESTQSSDEDSTPQSQYPLEHRLRSYHQFS